MVDLGASNRARAVLVYASNGMLRRRVPVTPGATRVVLPADVKPGMDVFLRMEN